MKRQPIVTIKKVRKVLKNKGMEAKYLQRLANIIPAIQDVEDASDCVFNMGIWGAKVVNSHCFTAACALGSASEHPWFKREGLSNQKVKRSFYGSNKQLEMERTFKRKFEADADVYSLQFFVGKEKIDYPIFSSKMREFFGLSEVEYWHIFIGATREPRTAEEEIKIIKDFIKDKYDINYEDLL